MAYKEKEKWDQPKCIRKQDLRKHRMLKHEISHLFMQQRSQPSAINTLIIKTNEPQNA